ncbi:MAG TPA: hypothetical protein VGH19_00475 [Verrucomicrobiae bacterium]
MRFPRTRNRLRLRTGAFTIVEVLISMAVVALMFVSLYAGISQGLAVISSARENMRATQIMIEKIELLRLYSWDQITDTSYVPKYFAERLMPANSTNAASSSTNEATLTIPAGAGTVFVGSIVFADAPVNSAYSANMRLATLTVTWTNANILRTRSMQTLVAERGIHDYVY